MLLALLRPVRRSRTSVGPSSGAAGDVERWLARADEALAAAGEASSLFERDARYDEVVTAMVHATLPTLLRFCEHKLPGDPVAAEDVVQASYLALRESLPMFEGRSSLKTFLYGIAFNRCRDHQKLAGRRAAMTADHQATIAESLHRGLEEPDIGTRGDSEKRARELEAALARLPERERFVLHARFVEEVDYEDLLPRFRARFGGTINTREGLRTLLFNAKKRLIELLRSP